MSEFNRQETPGGHIVVGGDSLEILAPVEWGEEKLEIEPSVPIPSRSDTGNPGNTSDYFIKAEVTPHNVIDMLKSVAKDD